MDSLELMVIEILKDTIVKQKEIASPEINSHSKYGDSFGWDSMTHMFFFINLENKFQVKFPRNKLIELDSIHKIVAEIKAMLNEK